MRKSVTGVRMPPVQHVAFDELLRGVTQNLRAGHIGPMVHERGRVLKLIAKAERAARLIVGAIAPTCGSSGSGTAASR